MSLCAIQASTTPVCHWQPLTGHGEKRGHMPMIKIINIAKVVTVQLTLAFKPERGRERKEGKWKADGLTSGSSGISTQSSTWFKGTTRTRRAEQQPFEPLSISGRFYLSLSVVATTGRTHNGNEICLFSFFCGLGDVRGVLRVLV